MKSMALSLGAAVLFFAVTCWGAGWNFIASGILSILLYGGLLLLTKPKRKIGGVDVELLSGGEELERKLSEAREDFESIGQSMGAIEDPELKRESAKLHETAGSMIHFLEKNPEKIMSARRFIDYYQNTASKLLKKYVELQNTGLGTEDVSRLKNQTKQALFTLNRAFEGQFEKLMQNELMDMDADIRLLKQTMKMEGYEE